MCHDARLHCESGGFAATARKKKKKGWKSRTQWGISLEEEVGNGAEIERKKNEKIFRQGETEASCELKTLRSDYLISDERCSLLFTRFNTLADLHNGKGEEEILSIRIRNQHMSRVQR